MFLVVKCYSKWYGHIKGTVHIRCDVLDRVFLDVCDGHVQFCEKGAFSSGMVILIVEFE